MLKAAILAAEPFRSCSIVIAIGRQRGQEFSDVQRFPRAQQFKPPPRQL
jgi:hypothetical protein